MSPAEGFLLSRVDGHTPWLQLRQIGGIPPAEVDRCLERWLSEGVLVIEDSAAGQASGESLGSEPELPHSEAEGDACRGLESRIDLSLDLAPELQRRILDFEAALDRSYFQILGIARDANTKEIKRAYFALAKVFHPDRYFRRNIGEFAGRLERIFRKLVEAYELLSDPMTRQEIDRSMGDTAALTSGFAEELEAAAHEAKEFETEERAAEERSPQSVPPPQKLTKRQTLERLRGHFRLPEKLLTERRAKASLFYDAAMSAAYSEQWAKAVPSLRLALAFDPWNNTYRESFAEIQSHYHEHRAKELLGQDPSNWDSETQLKALHMLEDLLIYRPSDSEVNHRAAVMAHEVGEHERALEYAEAACELCPESAPYHLTLGRVLIEEGDDEQACDELNTAAFLDPKDQKANLELRKLRRSLRRTH